ncbi:unnamed protein product [Callosobruchus maculatus]|uniref:NADH dehydrogenase subunit 5 C-terminal domain-containing protein n=1 Tax=Callosobruchus maculatus TaxID=64391 RepID=A0A653BLS7_CALMS|nr:unnamed protein product [Callosobruchus maculatus]VEN36862.1 unnamed protein product [Callosobruchus maculatus]
MALIIIIIGIFIGYEVAKFKLGKVYTKIFDQGWHEYYGGKNLKLLAKFSQVSQRFSRSHLKIYFLLLIL